LRPRNSPGLALDFALGDWNDKRGSFSLEELQSYKGPFCIEIERDLCFGERRAGEVMRDK